MGLEEGQIVLCTVDKVVGTTVFVKIEEDGEGTINTSEIAPGRIRNLRDYVVPGKKIVCKILRITSKGAQLSLRRVKQNERKELLDQIEKEKSYSAIIRTVIGKEKSEDLIKKVIEEENLIEFLDSAKENPKALEKYFSKIDSEKIIKILESKKEKIKEIKQNFKLSSKKENGILIIKNIIKDSCKGLNCQISYLAAGKYRLSLKGEDFKKLKSDSTQFFEIIESLAKKNQAEFSLEK
ncbi:MAG: hypothetical protein WC438_02235 [Candidatus Pacearchaeota archaeon]